MFFNLATDRLENFPYHHILPNGLVLNTDDGWEVYTVDNQTVIVKGYANQFSLSDIVNEIITHDIPVYKGNFCAIVSDSEHVKILHDTNRGFPLWASNKNITNLEPLAEQIWADHLLTVNNDMSYELSYFKPYTKNTDELTDEKILDKLHTTICETYEKFLTHNTKPLKIFLSGGIDTTTNWAYLDKFTKNYEIVDYEYVKFTPFFKLNNPSLKQFWAYKQIHLWDESCVLVSGGMGDENLLRGPSTLAIALKKYDLELQNILEPDDYHYKHFSKYLPDLYDSINNVYPTIKDIQEHILNTNVNDHQHWHIDKTITFTPFKDIELLALVLNSSKELLVAQAKSGFINRQLISKLDPDKLNKISYSKNNNMLARL
jgi:hypothetical protein|tara:strand:- start:722 stop:1843 length:1122 start_codon:yes stop_codon:yes gene_type:complete